MDRILSLYFEKIFEITNLSVKSNTKINFDENNILFQKNDNIFKYFEPGFALKKPIVRLMKSFLLKTVF
jgi:hypothetical protein